MRINKTKREWLAQKFEWNNSPAVMKERNRTGFINVTEGTKKTAIASRRRGVVKKSKTTQTHRTAFPKKILL